MARERPPEDTRPPIINFPVREDSAAIVVNRCGSVRIAAVRRQRYKLEASYATFCTISVTDHLRRWYTIRDFWNNKIYEIICQLIKFDCEL